MNVKECYAAFGGCYEEAIGRLGKEERMIKYLKMFLGGNDVQLLCAALADENYEDAFRNVHNLKGVSLNLALTPLIKTSEPLCEALRHGKPESDVSQMLADVKAAYDTVTAAISNLD